MTNSNKPAKAPTEQSLKTQKKLQGKLEKANFPEMKHQADSAFGEEE